MSDTVWHDVECGAYTEDLALWRALAAAEAGPVLDAGAGTGRVALELARYGHAIVALDRDAVLLAELERRAGMLPVQIAVADASSFELAGRRFGLIIAPMQLVQLLDGPAGRAGFLRSARAHLAPAGLLACAISEQLDAFDDSDGVLLPLPDVTFRAGVRYSSQPVAIRDEGDRVAIERIRETLAADGRRTATGDLIYLDRLDARTFEAEGRAAGLHPITPREIRQTDDHVGSSVVMLRA